MSDYPYDLGAYSRRISTSSDDAQRWFDRGLNWTFAFNHEEAVNCFSKALEGDPDCPMARWGIAYASGPNYNKPWDLFDEVDLKDTIARTYEATRRSLDVIDKADPAEQALIRALEARYQAPEPVDDLDAWNDDYADAMRFLYRQNPDDLDLATLFAEALMNRTPWQMWDLDSGQPADGASTEEAVEVLERALEHPDARYHPGLLHMYIH
ncbi:MAG: hypothetical protein ACOC9Y_08650, partial [Chloroflexota bacterium]